jgi:type IV pilus assembly protein PilY1
MKKIIWIAMVLVAFFSSNPLSRASDTDLFTTQAPPNILLILDNSNSMDEDFWGNGVGSFASSSKTVVGKKALRTIIDTYAGKMKFGLMTYQINSVSARHIHNSPVFVSYEPKSYCPNPPPECVTYAQTGNAGARSTCATQCQADNPSFDPDYLNQVITGYAIGSPIRNRYASLVYPKTQRMPNPTDAGKYIYYKHAYPFYSDSDQGTSFGYSNGYNYADGTIGNVFSFDYYDFYRNKTGTSDGLSVYSNYFFSSYIIPTDSDYAQGYLDFGRRIMWYHTGPTWFADGSSGKGYLHVKIGDLLNTVGNPTTTYTNLKDKLDPKENNSAGYMSCGNADKNTCAYVLNAGLTPTEGTLLEATNYFSGNGSYTTPIEYQCQKNFIIYVTDGLPSVDKNGTIGNADALMPGVLNQIALLRNTPAKIGSTTYNFDIQTYVLGVGLSDEAKPKLNSMAVQAGTDVDGFAYYADKPDQLIAALNTIFLNIVEKAYSFTSPSVPAVRMVDKDLLYISSFTPSDDPFWPGSMKAFQLETDGTLKVNINGEPLNAPLWTSSIPTTRTIKTYVGGALKDFTAANVTKTDLAVSNDAKRDDLVAYVRGLGLGDIFHSNAVIVGAPSSFYYDAGFSGAGEFYETKKNRTKVVIAGANDGMLHAFHADTGVEQWAFIPNEVLTTLQSMKNTHTYYVDSTPKVADVWFYSAADDTTKDKTEWHTVLICGLRKGGKTYFALDITDTLNPTYLWQFPKSTDATTLDKVGQSWSEPAIGKVKIEEGGELVERWVAFIGGGMDTSENKSADANTGRSLFVIDIKTGDILWEFSYDAADSLKKKMDHSMAAPPTAVDTNFDGFVDRVYVGDLGGQMWSFDFSFNEATKKSNSLWAGKAKLLFTAPGTNPEKHMIYYPPAVAFDQYRIPWVYFGTGNREDPRDWNAPEERFYAVRDDGNGNYPRTEGDLKDVTGLNTFTQDTTKRGWYIKLEKGTKSLEKVLAKPAVFNRLLYFTTFLNVDSADLCEVSGVSRNYVVEYHSGGGALLVDDMTDLSGTPGARFKEVGSGAPSAPVMSVNLKGKASTIIGTTKGQIYSQTSFSPSTNKEPIYWREVIP